VEELDDVWPHDVERHGGVVVEILAAALGALEVQCEGGRVVVLEPGPELETLPL